MGSSTRPIVAILAVAAAAIAFWVLALSPKRDEADQLGKQAERLTASIESARAELSQATAARRTFPAAYHQLVELGQAVPSTDETPSLLVELGQIASASGVQFDSFQLEGEGEGTSEVPAESTEGSAQARPATEVAASLLPLGASIGSAGLATMPYSLQFKGDFFQIGSFIGRIDALVKANNNVAVDGRLVTINGFSLVVGGEGEEAGSEKTGAEELDANFSVTTYLTPPGQGLTAGASPAGPAPAEASTQTVAAR
jgi:Tfp pilus assembly protein PilO